MDELILGLRVIVSLAAVLGLMWFLARRVRRGNPAARARALHVVSRQNVGPKASIVLVDTDGRRFLLGVTEHGISVLHSGDAPAAEAVAEPEAAPLSRRAARHAVDSSAFDRELRRQLGSGPEAQPLAGSILDLDTWRQAAGALRSGRRS